MTRSRAPAGFAFFSVSRDRIDDHSLFTPNARISVARCSGRGGEAPRPVAVELVGAAARGAPAPPRCVKLERGGDTSNSGFRPGRKNFVDARSGECRSRGVQGRRQGIHDCATIRAIAVRSAKGACLGDAGAQTLSLVPRTGTARLRMHVYIMYKKLHDFSNLI